MSDLAVNQAEPRVNRYGGRLRRPVQITFQVNPQRPNGDLIGQHPDGRWVFPSVTWEDPKPGTYWVLVFFAGNRRTVYFAIPDPRRHRTMMYCGLEEAEEE